MAFLCAFVWLAHAPVEDVLPPQMHIIAEPVANLALPSYRALPNCQVCQGHGDVRPTRCNFGRLSIVARNRLRAVSPMRLAVLRNR